ncbi:hypothetical protein BHE74_00010546 [Ensete ventricosum]|nr:hypothetical protein BHE74_00010546 [Ensete ventricosum]RZS26413.1 hypothetical protein BHM03_00059752 [Ensete ventricosum]
MNLKEGDRYVVNHGEDLTTIDFGSYVSLAKKEDAGIAGRGDPARGRRNRMDRAEAYGEETVITAGVIDSGSCDKMIMPRRNRQLRGCNGDSDYKMGVAGSSDEEVEGSDGRWLGAEGSTRRSRLCASRQWQGE